MADCGLRHKKLIGCPSEAEMTCGCIKNLSFTRAADELFVTQAAVSHQIKSLEDFLGLKLFRRRNRSLLLTEEGQSYFQDIKEIFSQLTEATRKLQARSAKGIQRW